MKKGPKPLLSFGQVDREGGAPRP